MFIKSVCNVLNIYTEYHLKSLQNVDVISVKKGTEANQNEKQEHKIPKKCT